MHNQANNYNDHSTGQNITHNCDGTDTQYDASNIAGSACCAYTACADNRKINGGGTYDISTNSTTPYDGFYIASNFGMDANGNFNATPSGCDGLHDPNDQATWNFQCCTYYGCDDTQSVNLQVDYPIVYDYYDDYGPK